MRVRASRIGLEGNLLMRVAGKIPVPENAVQPLLGELFANATASA